jgi:hypothetical protein
MMNLKQAYDQLNHLEATFWILGTKAQKEVIQYCELNTHAAKPDRDNDMPLNSGPIKPLMKYPRPEMNTLNDLTKWCAMRKGHYRITLLGVSRELPTSQTPSIKISISVISTMQNTFR